MTRGMRRVARYMLSLVSPVRRQRRRQVAALRASGMVDERFYLENNADVRQSGADPVEHYLRFGWNESRAPSANSNPAVMAKLIGDLLDPMSGLTVDHDLKVAWEELDPVTKAQLHASSWFDPAWYLGQVTGVRPGDLLGDYLAQSDPLAVSPHPLFDARVYMATYSDVRESHLHPWVDFVLHGEAEGRAPGIADPVPTRNDTVLNVLRAMSGTRRPVCSASQAARVTVMSICGEGGPWPAQAVACYEGPLVHEVVIVDMGIPEPDRLKLAETAYVQIISESGERSAATLNEAAREAVTQYLFICHDDLVMTTDALESLVDYLDRHPEAAAAGPLLVGPDAALDSSGGKLFRCGEARDIGRGAPPHHWALRTTHEVDYLPSAGILIRRKEFLAVGGLDEALYVGDYAHVALCTRLHELGHLVVVHPGAQAVHGNAGFQCRPEARLHNSAARVVARAKFRAQHQAFLRRAPLMGAPNQARLAAGLDRALVLVPSLGYAGPNGDAMLRALLDGLEHLGLQVSILAGHLAADEKTTESLNGEGREVISETGTIADVLASYPDDVAVVVAVGGDMTLQATRARRRVRGAPPILAVTDASGVVPAHIFSQADLVLCSIDRHVPGLTGQRVRGHLIGSDGLSIAECARILARVNVPPTQRAHDRLLKIVRTKT